MIPSKGLNKDGKFIDQPDGTWLDAKNMIYDKSQNVLSNEGGTESHVIGLPANKKIIGSISINKDIYVFLCDTVSVNHEFGKIADNKTYIPLYKSYKLNLSLNFPVIAKFISNNIIVYTDYFNAIRYLNLKNLPTNDADLASGSEPNVQLGDKLLNLITDVDTTNTRFTIEPVSGGSLPEGTYSVYIRYTNDNGIKTNWINSNTSGYAAYCSALEYDANIGIRSEASSNQNSSGKAIKISFSVLDGTKNYIEIALIGYINNQILCKNVLKQKPSGITSITITKFEGDDIPLEDLFIKKKNLIAKDLEIVNNTLLAANIREDEEIEFQKYANNIVSNIVISKVGVTLKGSIDQDRQTLMPGEVYAAYITLVYKNDIESRIFHIPGRAPETGETSASSVTGLTNFKKYQVEDTGYNASADTDMAYWENTNEKYPTIDDFNSTSLGGLDLRGEKVRHHKIPSYAKIKNEVYSADTAVGRTSLIKVKLNFSNIVIPSSIISKIKGYKIYLAKRKIEDMCVLGFSPILYGGKMDNPSDELEDSYVSITSNLNSNNLTGENEKVVPDTNLLKFHCLDLMLNRPKINPQFIAAESLVELKMDDTPNDLLGSVAKSGRLKMDATSSDTAKRFSLHAYHSTNSILTVVNNFTDSIKRVNSYSYIPENSIFGEFYNRYGEEVMVLKGNFSGVLTSPTFQLIDTATVEHTGLYSLRQIPSDPYSSFYENNELFCLGYSAASAVGVYAVTCSSGDAFISLSSCINTAGIAGNKYTTDADGSAKGIGSMAVRIFATYLVNDALLRRQDKSRDNGEVYPHTLNSLALLNNFDPTKQIVIDINTSFAFQDEVHSLLNYNPFDKFNYDHPNRIIQFTNQDLENNDEITVTHLPNSYYELQKDKGQINTIHGIFDNLLIGCTNGNFITRGKQSLQINGDEAFIGNNDIFEIPPKLIVDIEGNYFGCQSRFTTKVTNYGAIIVDEILGKIYLFDGQSTPKEISGIGMFNYFKDNLTYIEDKYTIKNYTLVDLTSYEGFVKLQIDRGYNISKYNFNIDDIFYVLSLEDHGVIKDIESDDDNIYLYLDLPYTTGGTVNTSGWHYAKYDSPFYSKGIVLEYDKLYDRILLTKKHSDAIVDKYNFRGVYSAMYNEITNDLSNGDIFYYRGGLKARYSAAVADLISSDTEDRSFTISYDLKRGFWVSFHDYIPDLYLENNNQLLSYKSLTIYLHHNNDMARFYGTKYSSYITLVFNANPTITKKFKELLWNVMFYLDEVYDKTKTFDSIELNNHEVIGSNIVTLTPYISTTNQGNVRNVHDYWHFNQMRSSNNRMFGQYLQVKFNYDNSDDFVLYIYEIMTKFNYAKN